VSALKRAMPWTLVLGSVAFLALAPLAPILSSPYYQADGSFLIERVLPPVMARYEQRSITNYFYDYAQTQVNRITRTDTLARAVERMPDPGRDALLPPLPTRKAAAVLGAMLNVRQIPSTHLIEVRITSHTSMGAAEAVNAVLEAYLEEVQADLENKDERRLTYLMEAREKASREVDDLLGRLQAMASSTMTSTFVETYNFENHRLTEVQEALIQATARRLELEHTYRETAQKVARIRKLDIQALADELVAGDESLWSIKYWTYKTMQEMRASIDGIARGNPDREYVEERMRAMKDYEENLKAQVEERARRIVHDKRDYELERELLAARHAFQAALSTEQDLEDEWERLRRATAENAQAIIKGQEIAARLEHARDQLFGLDNRIQELQAESRAPLRISIEHRAARPTEPAGTNQKKYLAMFFLLAFGASGSLFLGHEVLDGRIKGPRDVENALGRPPSWPVSDYGRSQPGLAWERAMLERPASLPAKAVRSLALRLDQERRGHGARLVLFTGVEAGVGVTSVLLNTAQAMTAFCDRVLVLELNQTGRDLTDMYGHRTGGLGVADRLTGRCRLDSCLVRDSERGIWVLPMGRADVDPARMKGVKKLLDALAGRFDAVLIDASPVMRSDLTELLAQAVDTGVLLAQGERTTYRALRFSALLLARRQLPSLAAVLNWGAGRSRTRLERITDLGKNRVKGLARRLFPSLFPSLSRSPFRSLSRSLSRLLARRLHARLLQGVAGGLSKVILGPGKRIWNRLRGLRRTSRPRGHPPLSIKHVPALPPGRDAENGRQDADRPAPGDPAS
jgi:Mrp family chromosome partitioning ATPase/uncharacterized protein involved in exopolysaccharide biosynthesis